MKKWSDFWKYIWNFIRGIPRVLNYKLFKKVPPYDRLGKRKNITFEFSDDYIKQKLENGEPFAMIRFGGSELSALNNYEKIRLRFKRKYKKSVKYAMKIMRDFSLLMMSN